MKWMFSEEDIQMANKQNETMLNIIGYQGNANQKHNEMPLQTYKDG